MMNVQATNSLENIKRPNGGRSKNTDPYTYHKRRKLGRDHVHKTHAQSVHEASATSNDPLLGKIGFSSRRYNGAVLSSAPMPASNSDTHVPLLRGARPQKSRQFKKIPKNLPPLPPIADPSLETAVFTHPVCLPGHNQNKLGKSYDRLEFLGDAYIEIIASRLVYNEYPHMTAGRLSQHRESLIKNESLAAFSIAYGFEKRAMLPPKVSDIRLPISKRRPTDLEKQYVKMLGDVFEAYVAGIILSNASSGYQMAEEWLHQLWIPKLKEQNSAEVKEPPAADSKQQLAKRVLGKGARIEYREVAPPDLSESNSGRVWYRIGAFVTGWGWDGAKLGEGRAMNKSKAGMIAATQAMGNPLTQQIESIKKEFDQKVAEERDLQEVQNNSQEFQSGNSSNPFSQTSDGLNKPEIEKEEISESDNPYDSDNDTEDS